MRLLLLPVCFCIFSASAFGQKSQTPQFKATDSILSTIPFYEGNLFPKENEYRVSGTTPSKSENLLNNSGFDYNMPISRPNSIYGKAMLIHKPDNSYDYKLRIMDQPVQNSTQNQS